MEELTELFNILCAKVELLLTPIGGHKTFHLEGNAWKHTQMVIAEMGNDPLYRLAGLLHDIGKSRYYEVDEEGWFTYPNHAVGGAEMLHEFVPKESKYYNLLYWVIANHIKVIFMCRQKNQAAYKQKLDATIPREVDHKQAWLLLLSLGIADLKASICVPQENYFNQKNISMLEQELQKMTSFK